MIRVLRLLPILFLLIACGSSKHTARFVLLPDTQTYAEKFPEIVQAQTDWIAKESASIDLVIQQGDLTQNNNDSEWSVINTAFYKLDNKVPYVLAAGNHDMGSAPGKFADNRNTEMFNQYFPSGHMSALPGFAGVFENDKMENAYYLLQACKIKWMIITLEFGPRNKVLDWANKIVTQHPDRTIIINTHAYMYSDSTRQGPADNGSPHSYGVDNGTGDEAVNDGEEMWNKLIKLHPNIRFVFSGHVTNSGVGTLVSINDEGYPVYQMLANFQEGVKGSVKGGNGFLRILDLDMKKKILYVKTFSPYINEYNKQPGHEFIIRNVMFGSRR
ncbi:MAG: metallophosphoesterase [Ginsengibacter sp.]